MKTLTELAKRVEDEGYAPVLLHPEVWRLCELVAASEREACARVCESRQTPGTGSVAVLNGAANAIRARGNT